MLRGVFGSWDDMIGFAARAHCGTVLPRQEVVGWEETNFCRRQRCISPAV